MDYLNSYSHPLHTQLKNGLELATSLVWHYILGQTVPPQQAWASVSTKWAHQACAGRAVTSRMLTGSDRNGRKDVPLPHILLWKTSVLPLKMIK